MKKSGRDRLGINLTFNYNIGSSFFIRNDLSVDNVKAKNSPYNEFLLYTTRIRMTGFMTKKRRVCGKTSSRLESVGQCQSAQA